MIKPVLLLTAALFASAPVMAGTVYRCVGSDGIPNYTSKRASNAVCNAVSRGNDNARVSGFAASSGPGMATIQVAPSAPVTPARSTSQVVFNSAPAGGTPRAVKTGGGGKVLRGAVYRYEKNGVVHYTNVRPAGAAQSKILFSYIETCYACGTLPGVNFGNVRLNTLAFGEEIRSAASQFGVEEAVVRAIIHAESSYRPNAVSHAGAQGLMQLIPATASRFGVSDPFNPAQNISGGVKYLAWLMKRYSSNLTLVAAAYNAGEGAVDRNGGVPPYSETRRYVQRVGQLADRYRTALAAN